MSRVQLSKGKVGPNSLGGYEKKSALVGFFGVTTGTVHLELDKPLTFGNVNEIEGYGITASANALLYHHISEYFRMAGRGAYLTVLSVTKPASAKFEDLIEAQSVRDMVAGAGGELFQVGFAYCPLTAGTHVDGLHSEMLDAIKAGQAFADWCAETNRPIHVVLECADVELPATSMLDLRAIKEGAVKVMCPQVSCMIGQDYLFASTLSGREQKHAAVGVLLGCMAAQPVSYNVGEVETMSLTNSIREKWISAGFSSHEKVVDKEAQLETLNSKGYIFGEYYTGEVCLNDDHVCTPVIVDDEGNMNEHTIALSRTNAKVFREIFRTYQPKIKSTVPVNPVTGLLQAGMLKYFEGLGDRIFDNMQAKAELSGGQTTVDSESNLLFGDKILKVYYDWVPMGSIGRIEGVVNIKKALT